MVPAKDESINFGTTQNVFIEGDNLEVLIAAQVTTLKKAERIKEQGYTELLL